MNELEVSCQQVKEWLDDNEKEMFLLDCREQNEFDQVQIEGANLYPMSKLTTQVQKLEDQKDKLVVVYCHHGGRSLQVATYLKNRGFTNVKSMAGGIDEWAEKIDPTKPRY